MSAGEASLGILLPAFVAGLLVTLTHVPLGMQVLARGIVFIDLAVAQIAGVGVIFADFLGWEPRGAAVQVAALAAAMAGALFLTWTDRRWPAVQEAIIGVVFVLASSIGLLLLAHNVRGAEHLKDLLLGQILWVGIGQLPYVGLASAIVAGLWFWRGERFGRVGFYALFAVAVTMSVQLVGLYLVFATLVIPALATHAITRRRHHWAYLVGGLGYGAGLWASAATDLPTGAMVVCVMAIVGVAVAASGLGRSARV